jgi:hypothetical protein
MISWLLSRVGLIGGYWRQIFKYVAEPVASANDRPPMVPEEKPVGGNVTADA